MLPNAYEISPSLASIDVGLCGRLDRVGVTSRAGFCGINSYKQRRLRTVVLLGAAVDDVQFGAHGGRGVPGEHLPEQDAVYLVQEGQ